METQYPTKALRMKAACLKPAFILLGAFTLLALQGCNSNASNGGKKISPTAYCSQTVAAAFEACTLDVMEEFALNEATCINIEDETERADCLAEADEERNEEDALCGEQRTARQEVCTALGESRYDPELDPADFVDPLTIGDTTAANPYLPLVPGTEWVYETADGTVTVTVSSETIDIEGIECIIVTDVEEEDEVTEITDDWYAQDVMGNVWYCGELSRNFEDGLLTDLDGSFMHGEDGAKAGILMKAMPMVGDIYRQEWFLSEAEDVAEVLSLTASESTESGDFSCTDTCLMTREFTPLEPGVNEHKFFAEGIGLIVAFDVEEPDEREELVSFTTP